MRSFPPWRDPTGRSDAPRFAYSGPRGIVVYGLIDPIDDTIRYVGVTTNPYFRMLGHIRRSTNAGMRRWFAELSPLVPRMVTLGRVHRKVWEQAERQWIKFWRARGRLYNIHRGGINEKYAKKKPPPIPKKRKASIDSTTGLVVRKKVGSNRTPHRHARHDKPKRPDSFLQEVNREVREMRRLMTT